MDDKQGFRIIRKDKVGNAMVDSQIYIETPLNFEGPEALYKQLYALIKERINNGSLAPNQKIPSEAWFSEQFKVSRITVRKTMEMLADEDLIVKRSGKGSFVCPKKIQDSIVGDLSFSLTCQVNNVTPHSEVIAKEMRDPTPSDVQDLGVDPGDQVVYIKRVRYADGNPIIVENVFMTKPFAYLLGEDLFSQSLYALASRQVPVEQWKIKRSLEISHATPSQAKLLNLKAGEPTMLCREVISDGRGNPLFRIRQVIAGERVRFVTIDE